MVFNEKLQVMQVRPNYSILYQFRPEIKIEKNYVKTHKNFVRYIQSLSTNWKPGAYFLKHSKGTFAYFTIKRGHVKLFKKSKLGKEYLCWQYFDAKTINEKQHKKSNGKKLRR